MINEFSVKPKPKTKLARNVFSALLASAALVFALSFVVDRYSSVIGMAAMIFLVAALTVYNKYISCEYIYDITSGRDGEALFVVRKLVGKRETTLCRVELNALIAAERLERGKEKKAPPEPDVARYSYCPTMLPDTAYLLKFRSSYEKADVIVEISDELANELLSASRFSGNG